MLAPPFSPSSNHFGPVAKGFLSCELTVFFGMNCALSIFHFKSTHFSRRDFPANEEKNFLQGEGADGAGIGASILPNWEATRGSL